MNPFNLPGPEFLLFYFCFSLVVIIANFVFRRRAESGAAPKIDLHDPYLIAYLRGGESDVLRVALISLIDRGILVTDDHFIRRADHVDDTLIEQPIEYEILKKFGAHGQPSSVLEAASVFTNNELKSALQPYRDKLERAGLMPDAAVRIQRLRRLSLALLFLVVTGVSKIIIGISNDRPVFFLIAMMTTAIAVAAALSFPRLTARGDVALESVTSLYAGLMTRINSMTPGSSPAELAMFAAVFGVGALAATPFAYADDFFHQTRRHAQASSGCSSGSSCSSSGSSSSCGSSDGGGGCGGGCGGCS